MEVKGWREVCVSTAAGLAPQRGGDSAVPPQSLNGLGWVVGRGQGPWAKGVRPVSQGKAGTWEAPRGPPRAGGLSASLPVGLLMVIHWATGPGRAGAGEDAQGGGLGAWWCPILEKRHGAP